jgi:hypothetical protein
MFFILVFMRASLYRNMPEVQSRYAAARIADDLPDYKHTPAEFRGSGELMSW